jgi:hypothetical protein
MSRKLLYFSSVFTNEDVYRCFYNHLVEERNTESLKFIKEVENFKNEKTVEKINKIYERYIMEESKDEINISSQEKKSLLNVYKTFEKENDFEKVEEILEKTSQILKNTLYNDSFFRFLRKKECLALIEKFKDKKDIVFDPLEIKYSYTEKDYQKRIITEKILCF